jgi:hypothetical protein
MLKTKSEVLSACSRSEILLRIASGDVLSQTTIVETKTRLSERVDDSFISHKPVFNRGSKSHHVPYIAWFDVFTLLDYLAPLYSFECNENQVGELFVVKATLTVICTDGELKASALGSESLSSVDFGGCMAEASAQAVRRVAATIGLGRYLYNGDNKPSIPTQTRQCDSNQVVIATGKKQITREQWLQLQNK